jgi:hypothetical protein
MKSRRRLAACESLLAVGALAAGALVAACSGSSVQRAGDGGPTGSGGATGAGGAAGAGGVMGTGGVTGTGGATGTGGSAASIPASDGFDGTALDASWIVLRPDLADISVGQGTLSVRPHPNALWYQAGQGELVYKLVTGDFKATATVHTRKATDSSMPPDQNVELGGVMARSPDGSSENYVLIVVGFAEMGHLAIEHKDTTNSNSVFAESPWTADAELRLCRTGSTFAVFKRNPGDASWGSADYQATRTDLPATMQVGAVAYDNDAAPDLNVTFDELTFAPVGGGCTQ